MLTREQILEIDTYCAEHKVSQNVRLDELNIPRHQFYRWKKKYREADEAGGTPDGGAFVQLAPGGAFVSPIIVRKCLTLHRDSVALSGIIRVYYN